LAKAHPFWACQNARLTRVIGLAGGGKPGPLVEESGAVGIWLTYNYGQTNVPSWLANALG